MSQLTSIEFDQLQNIIYFGPVFSGDLICKTTKNSLIAKGFIVLLPGLNKPGAPTGVRIGGFVATDDGRIAYLRAAGSELFTEEA